MRVVVLCEGKTEAALRDALRGTIQLVSPECRVGVDPKQTRGRVTNPKTASQVGQHLANPDVSGVIVLTDVYPDYSDAESARAGVRKTLGDHAKNPCVRIHLAKFVVEAWLVPFWKDIAKSIGVPPGPIGAEPEAINDQSPPSKLLSALFRKAGKNYEKPIDAKKWLTAERLKESSTKCPELKSFLNSLLEFAGTDQRL